MKTKVIEVNVQDQPVKDIPIHQNGECSLDELLKIVLSFEEQTLKAKRRIADCLASEVEAMSGMVEEAVSLAREQKKQLVDISSTNARFIEESKKHHDRVEGHFKVAEHNDEQVRARLDALLLRVETVNAENIERNVVDSILIELLGAYQEALNASTRQGEGTGNEAMDGTLAKFSDLFLSQGVELIRPAHGDAFDPKQHKALSVVQTKDKQSHQTIAQAHFVGLRRESRVIRPAIVEVSVFEEESTIQRS